MKKIINKKYQKFLGRPVMVKWVDSGFSDPSNWRSMQEGIETTEQSKGSVLSMGFFLHETKEYIALVQTVDLESNHYNNLFGILKRDVISLSLLDTDTRFSDLQAASAITRQIILDAHQKQK